MAMFTLVVSTWVLFEGVFFPVSILKLNWIIKEEDFVHSKGPISFCRPDGVNTVTIDEKGRFEEIKDRLKAYLGNQITQFR